MPACSPFRIPPPAAVVPSRARPHKHARPVSAASCGSGGMRSLLPVPVAVMMMMASVAFGVARAQGTWSTAQLSVARYYLAAASVGNVALFAGGGAGGALLCRVGGGAGVLTVACALFWMFARAAVLRFCLPCDRLLSHARQCRCYCLQCRGSVQ